MKCGPDKCPITTFSDLTPAEQREARARLAKTLYEQNFTMEQIAKQLGDVGVKTISRDLEGFVITTKPHRPKGGRPHGSGNGRQRPSQDSPLAAALVLDQGKTREEAAAEANVSLAVTRSSVVRLKAKREALADLPVDAATLSMSAQQKLAGAIRQEKAKLDREFEHRVLADIQRRMEETILPQYRKEQADARQVMEGRKGVMDKATFNKIRRCLHPDSRNSISDKLLAEGFDAFMALEKRLLNEKDSPTTFVDLPRNYAEWMQAKQRTSEARKAKRSNNRSVPAQS